MLLNFSAGRKPGDHCNDLPAIKFFLLAEGTGRLSKAANQGPKSDLNLLYSEQVIDFVATFLKEARTPGSFDRCTIELRSINGVIQRPDVLRGVGFGKPT